MPLFDSSPALTAAASKPVLRRDRGREDLVGRALLVVRQVEASASIEEAQLRADFPRLRLLGLELGVGHRRSAPRSAG